jgi:HlyD family secretion protein
VPQPQTLVSALDHKACNNGYRVDVRIIIWEGNDVLKVPASALFRRGQGWSLFVEENGGRAPAPLR